MLYIQRNLGIRNQRRKQECVGMPACCAINTNYGQRDRFVFQLDVSFIGTTPEKGWSRTGTLSGTSALVKHFPDGECWILITNTSTYKGPGQARHTDALFKQCRELYSNKLPDQNLFD